MREGRPERRRQRHATRRRHTHLRDGHRSRLPRSTSVAGGGRAARQPWSGRLLLAQDPRTGDVVPWLAESWTTDKRATEYTFKLRGDATFSDGSPVDAAAVKANFDRIVAPTTKSLLAGFFAGYTGTSVTAERTVVVRFSQPNAGFLQATTTAFLGMQSPGSFAAGPQATCRKVVGSGPFTMAEYIPQQRVALARREGYRWAPRTAAHQGNALLEKVVLSIAPDNGVRSGSLRSSQVDAAGNVTPKDAIALGEAGFDVHRREQAGIAYSLFLNSAKAPWNDVNLRRAVAQTVDRAQVVKTLYHDQYSRASSVLTPTTPGYRASETATSATEAARLLDAAGWAAGPDGIRSKDGQRLSLRWTYVAPARDQRDLLAQLVQQQLKAVGVEVLLDPAPAGDVIRRQTTGDWQMSDISFLRADADVLRTVLQSSAGGRPRSSPTHPRRDSRRSRQQPRTGRPEGELRPGPAADRRGGVGHPHLQPDVPDGHG
ncbi:ABC transporter substrate-binding protein [Micromonospora sp. M12]